ncbi:hypothetical protein VPH35_091613 [Triticum aestivum]
MYCLLSRPYAFGCVLKMRTSQGFDPGHSYGHFFLDPQYENVQHINCCESIQIIIDVTQKYMSSWGSTSTRLLHEFMSSAVARSSTRLMKSGGARAGPWTSTLDASLIHYSKILTASTSIVFATLLTVSPILWPQIN